jgi:FkbM family methyltransferase
MIGRKDVWRVEQVILENGLKIHCINKAEALSIQNEIKSYFKYGISVNAGDTVVDIGANIGIFSLVLHFQLNRSIKIYAFEPLPELYQVLQENVRLHHPDGSIQTFAMGILDYDGEKEFVYYPHIPELSTAYPERWAQDLDQMQNAFLGNWKNSPYYYDESDSRIAPELLERVRKFRSIMGIKRMFEARRVVCPVCTLSKVIRDNRLQRIDLLKVDVEKSEWEVLRGIAANNWPQIRQIVLEAHDGESLEKIRRFLAGQGYQIFQERAPAADTLTCYTLYAIGDGATKLL